MHKSKHKPKSCLDVLYQIFLDVEQGKFEQVNRALSGLSRTQRQYTELKLKLQMSQDAVGTIAWMAPELFERGAIYTKKSDVYSLGITFWELASRKTPFADANNPSLIPSWISKGDREVIPQDCPPKLASLITACWDNTFGKRPDPDLVVSYLKSDYANDGEFRGNRMAFKKFY